MTTITHLFFVKFMIRCINILFLINSLRLSWQIVSFDCQHSDLSLENRSHVNSLKSVFKFIHMSDQLICLLFVTWNSVDFFKQIEGIFDDIWFFFDRTNSVSYSFEKSDQILFKFSVVVFASRLLSPQDSFYVLYMKNFTCFSLVESAQLSKIARI